MNIMILYYWGKNMKPENVVSLPQKETQEDIDSQVYKQLIEEVKVNRNNAVSMLEKVKKYSTQIDSVMPNSTDFKNRFVVENKMKVMSELIGNQLNILKFLDDSVKTEFDLRRKYESLDKKGEQEVNLRTLMSALEQMDTDKD